MVLKYVLKNFSRRKVRTILMILSLLVSTALIVTMSATVETVRQSNVDLIASAVGRYDIAISKTDTSSDPFLMVDETVPLVMTADQRVTAVYPRLESDIEFNAGAAIGRGTLLALDPAVDDVGFVDVVAGEYKLGDGQTAVLEETALNYNLSVGDAVDISYSFPLPREAGHPELAGASQRRSSERFTISAIVRQDGITDSGVRAGFIVALSDVQAWLNLPGQAQRLIVVVDSALYQTNNAEVAALRVRSVARAVQQQLGDEYSYTLVKAAALDGMAQGFLAIQALINTYGLIALGIVGLLVHTLVMTNVQEQRRDMAVLRILGGQRNLLFGLVIVEVLVIGAVGVGLGVGLGQLITAYIVVPIIEGQLLQQGGMVVHIAPQVSVTAVLPAIISAFVVLILSSIKPAQDAARTKVMHAINPGVADNIQLEDLAQLRERRPDAKLFFGGLALMLIFGLIAGFQAVDAFGGPALEVMFVLLALALLVLGLGLMFFITTIPFERFVLFVMGFIFPRVTYFARRNVGRGQLRNTLISLLVLFSGVLPSFLATQMALENANYETSARLDMGAPVNLHFFGSRSGGVNSDRLAPSFVYGNIGAVPGMGQLVGISYAYTSRAADSVGLRSARVTAVGIDGRLNDVLFSDMVEFASGSAASLDEIQTDPNAIIISEGLAELLAVSLGDTIKLTGEGLDHIANARIVGIARRIPGFSNIGRSRLEAANNSTVLMSLEGFRNLVTALNAPIPAPDDPIFVQVLANLTPNANPDDVAKEMGERYGLEYYFWSRFLPIELESNARAQATQRIFLLVLTVISFTTAVFGVFAVIYVTIYARRLEIGMMKAVGMLRRELTGMLVVESIAMTLGAALAGIAAGASMGYVSFYGQRALQQQPSNFAIDTTVMPFIVFMVVLASVLGAAFSARRIVKKQAVDILRMQ